MPDPLDQPVARRVTGSADDSAEGRATGVAADDGHEPADATAPPPGDASTVAEHEPATAGGDRDGGDPPPGPATTEEPVAGEAETAAATGVATAVGDGDAGESPGDGDAGDAGESPGDGDAGDGDAGEGGPTEGPAPEGGRTRKAKKPRSRTRVVLEWAAVIGGALLVALVVRSTLAQAFWIPSPSMEPTLHEGDRVLVNKLSYDLHDVHRGDIVVFERPPAAASLDPSQDIPDLIKRVVGLPGDMIEARADGSVYVNGRRLEEPYLPDGTRTGDLPLQEVPEGQVFVMGDNRANSSDSRDFGPIDEELIIGRAFIRIWPLDDIGGL